MLFYSNSHFYRALIKICFLACFLSKGEPVKWHFPFLDFEYNIAIKYKGKVDLFVWSTKNLIWSSLFMLKDI